MDLARTCEMAAELVERVADNLGDDVEVRQVFMVVEIDSGDTLSYFQANSDDRLWSQKAFLAQVEDALFYRGEPVDDD